jgi:hypothetical protein
MPAACPGGARLTTRGVASRVGVDGAFRGFSWSCSVLTLPALSHLLVARRKLSPTFPECGHDAWGGRRVHRWVVLIRRFHGASPSERLVRRAFALSSTAGSGDSEIAARRGNDG